jgi:nucleoid-associated protein YgaU
VNYIKNLLKNLKLHESTISTVLGFLVIVVVGLLVVNYFRNLDSGQPFPSGAQTEDTGRPETYTVAAGDSLWSISEKVYGSGYNWVDIRDANNIDNPDGIVEGQDLVIPDVEVRSVGGALAQASITPEPTVEPTAEPTIVPTATPSPAITPSPSPSSIPTLTPTPKAEIASGVTDEANPEAVIGETTSNVTPGGSYTVVHGDNLWDIAVAAYGDGYRWVDIAEANDLVNPNIIHAGNVFVIPS